MSSAPGTAWRSRGGCAGLGRRGCLFGPKPREDHSHEPAERFLRGRFSGGPDRVDAVSGELVRRNVAADRSDLDVLADELADECTHFVASVLDLVVAMQQSLDVGVVMSV